MLNLTYIHDGDLVSLWETIHDVAMEREEARLQKNEEVSYTDICGLPRSMRKGSVVYHAALHNMECEMQST
jgi:hypothetical protein